MDGAGARGGSGWEVAAWTAAMSAWGFLVALMALAGDSANGAEFVGRFMGAALVTLLPALAIRWLYKKMGGGRVWSPWLFAIAALTALVAGAGRIADAGEEGPPPEVRPGSLLGEPPPGFRYVPTEPADERAIRELVAGLGDDATGYVTRNVVRRGRLEGFAAAIRLDEEAADAPGVEAGFRRGLERRAGKRARAVTLGGERVYLMSLRGGYMASQLDGSAVLVLVVGDRSHLRPLARAIMAD